MPFWIPQVTSSCKDADFEPLSAILLECQVAKRFLSSKIMTTFRYVLKMCSQGWKQRNYLTLRWAQLRPLRTSTNFYYCTQYSLVFALKLTVRLALLEYGDSLGVPPHSLMIQQYHGHSAEWTICQFLIFCPTPLQCLKVMAIIHFPLMHLPRSKKSPSCTYIFTTLLKMSAALSLFKDSKSN